MVRESQGKCKSDWKVREMLGKFFTFFTKMYQVDKPMMPFLLPDLLKLVKDLLACFAQRDVVESLVTYNDMTGFDTNDISWKAFPAIQLGFSADKIKRSDNFKKKKVSDRDMLGVRTDVKSVLKAMFSSYFRKRQSLIQ